MIQMWCADLKQESIGEMVVGYEYKFIPYSKENLFPYVGQLVS